jgi:ribokinase
LSIDCLSTGILVADHLTAPIPRLPQAGELILCDEMPLAIGGCAANVGADLARLGARVEVVGCVGSDVLGKFIIDQLAAAGVGIEHIRRS